MTHGATIRCERRRPSPVAYLRVELQHVLLRAARWDVRHAQVLRRRDEVLGVARTIVASVAVIVEKASVSDGSRGARARVSKATAASGVLAKQPQSLPWLSAEA